MVRSTGNLSSICNVWNSNFVIPKSQGQGLVVGLCVCSLADILASAVSHARNCRFLAWADKVL